MSKLTNKGFGVSEMIGLAFVVVTILIAVLLLIEPKSKTTTLSEKQDNSKYVEVELVSTDKYIQCIDGNKHLITSGGMFHSDTMLKF